MVKIDVKSCFIGYFFIGIAFMNQNAFARNNYLQVATWGGECATGKQQSPINIDTKTAVITKDLPSLKANYQITNVSVYTSGLGAKLNIGWRNTMLIDDRTYRLVSMSWHTPSEHTIDGKTFVAELQQYYVTSYSTTLKTEHAMIATVYQIGAPDPIVSALEPEMTKLANEMGPVENNKKVVEKVPRDKIPLDFLSKVTSGNYMAYRGSLTFPPCQEDIKWFITDPQTMTLEQAKLLNSLQSKSNKANSRPIQPLNGRPVLVKMN